MRLFSFHFLSRFSMLPLSTIGATLPLFIVTLSHSHPRPSDLRHHVMEGCGKADRGTHQLRICIDTLVCAPEPTFLICSLSSLSFLQALRLTRGKDIASSAIGAVAFVRSAIPHTSRTRSVARLAAEPNLPFLFLLSLQLPRAHKCLEG